MRWAIRGLMSKALAAKVVAEIPKNLTKSTAGDVESHLAGVLAV